MGLGIRANGKVYKRCLRKMVGQAKFSQVSEVGKGEEVLPGRDGQIRGAVVRLGTRNQQSTRIRQPVYPLEVQEATKGSDQPMNTNIGSSDQFTAPQLSTEAEDTRRRSRRIAANHSDDKRQLLTLSTALSVDHSGQLEEGVVNVIHYCIPCIT